ncbi:hypothetical protein MC885_011941 [Smutsia gigantea]|nr:hypothetical protein MC885_011941 [Smutsia gigantea]
MYLARRRRMPRLSLPSHPPLEDICQLFPLNVQMSTWPERCPPGTWSDCKTHFLPQGTASPLMGGQVSSSGSFSSLPGTMNTDWMSGLCPQLWDVPIHHLSIPTSGQGPAMHYPPCGDEVVCHTEQLDAGVRHLDLCIAHMLEGSERNLNFMRLVYTTALVEDTLTELSDWLEQHPREAVILACRSFEGMTEGLHEYLDTCIQNIFGDMLCPQGEVPTLHQLWARGQQVLMSYEDEGNVSWHGELWPRIPYWWGDQVKPEELVHYLERMKSRGRPGGLLVAGINLTEHLAYILLHLSESLKTTTLPSLPYLSRWVQEQCPGPGVQCTNIIAGDFIGTDAFIRLNEKLLPC